MENFWMDTIVLKPMGGSDLKECKCEAIKIAVENKCDVIFVHNDKKCRVNIDQIIDTITVTKTT